MICDLCGKSGKMYKAEIEGSRVVACESCAKYGKIFHEVKEEVKRKESPVKSTPKAPEVIQIIVKDYSSKIKNARERKGIKQEDFAKMINEKDSLIHHLESGKMEPSIELAKKLEKVLGIKLVDEIIIEPEEKKDPNLKASGPMTLGDLINLKKRK